MIPIIHTDNPYELDRLVFDEHYPALTRKNADFIEAVVGLDSNYSKDSLIVEPKGKYIGSIKYWFNQMKSGGDFAHSVLMAITAIDSTNSTHLEASKDGRKILCDRITSACSNCQELEDMLKADFESDDTKHILSILTERIDDKSGRVRYNLSFASKFCSYGALFLGLSTEYSKYDRIVSENLPIYAKCYLGKKYPASYFIIDSQQIKELSDEEKLLYRLKIYREYSDTIKEIIDVLQKDGICINREELDHIIWYGRK